MGIIGLFQFLRRYEQRVYIPTAVRGRNIAIDIFAFLHLSKGSHDTFMNLLKPYLENAASVIAVFDGSPSEERKELKASEKRNDMGQSIIAIQECINNPFMHISRADRMYLQTHVNDLNNRAWIPSPQYMWEAYDMLVAKNVECIVAPKGEEADTILANLSVDIVISNDSDLIAYGVKCLLRPNGIYYEKEAILTGLQFTEEDWSTFICICRTMKRANPEFAFTAIKLYKGDKEYICERYEELFV